MVQPTVVVGRPPAGRWAPVQLAATGIAAIGADVAFDPVHRHVPLCPFRAITGWSCPLCGGLRAVDDVARGHVLAALHANALIIAMALPVTLYWLDWLRRERTGRPRRTLPKVVRTAALIACVAFAVLRNLPGLAALRP